MKNRNEDTFIDLPRSVTDNYYLTYVTNIKKQPPDVWERPFKTSAVRLKELVRKKRKVKYFFEDMKFRNLIAIFKWGWSWLKHRFKRTHKFVIYKAIGSEKPCVYDLSADSQILLASDWGTGTPDAIAVANKMASLNPDITIHLGDVYYTGEKDEYAEYFFPYWPMGNHPEHATFLLNGNHEMYSGGHGYFDYALKQVNQQTSYFCLENDHWRIIGLDTGYYSVKADKGSVDKEKSYKLKLHRQLLKWLEQVVFADSNDTRGIILLSHHQWFCSFGTEYPKPVQQLKKWLKKPVLWFWGHEHVLAVYDLMNEFRDNKGRLVQGFPIYARCIGHGGMPIQLDRLQRNKEKKSVNGRSRKLILWDNRFNREVNETKLGYCGYVELQFQGDKLIASYHDANKMILQEEWTNSAAGLKGRLIIKDDDLKLEMKDTVYDLSSMAI